jgi:hypothetical protein
MNSFNYGNEYRTKESKGNIPALTMVKVTKVISHNDSNSTISSCG